MFYKYTPDVGDDEEQPNAVAPDDPYSPEAIKRALLPRFEDRPYRGIYRDPPIATVTKWSVADIRSALEAHTIGNFLLSGQLVDALTGDDRIASVLNTRVLGLLGLPLHISPSDTKDDKARKVARQIKKRFPQMIAVSGLAEFLRGGAMMGFAVGEIVWLYRRRQWLPTVRTWPPQLIYYRIDLRKFVAITMEGPVEITPGDGKWIVYAPHGDYRGWMQGGVRTTAIPYLVRQFAIRDWARHSERHGKPIIKTLVPAQADITLKDRFFASVAQMGDETTVECPIGATGDASFDLALLEADTVASEVFGELIKEMNTLISCALLGQNLTTEVEGGSYAAATVHGQIRQDYLEADAETLADCLQKQLLRPYCAYNFAEGARICPKLEWDTTPPDDKKARGDMFVQVAGAMQTFATAGVDIDVLATCEQFGITLTPDARRKLTPPATPGPSPFGLVGTAAPTAGAKAAAPAKVDSPAAADPENHAAAGQVYVDGVVDRAKRAAVKALRPHAKRVHEAVNGATSYDDLRARLKAALRTADPTRVAHLVEKSILMGNLAGRSSVHRDAV